MLKTTTSPAREATEKISYIRPVAFPGAELLVASNSTRRWHVFHECYAFCACGVAAAGWRYRGREYFSDDGDVMLLEPGEIHSNTRILKKVAFKAMFIPTQLRQLGVTTTTHFRFAQTQEPRLYGAIYRFCNSVETGATVLEQQTRFDSCVDLLTCSPEIVRL